MSLNVKSPIRNGLSNNKSSEEDRSRAVIWTTLIGIIVCLIWSYLAEIDEVTRGMGSVIASSRTQKIQSQDGGVLEQILVNEGDTVGAGDVLARINRTRAEAAYLETRSKLAGLSAKLSRLRAEALGEEIVFNEILSDYPQLRDNEMALMKTRHLAFSDSIASLERLRELAEKELAMNRPLALSGDVSQTDIIRLERQVAEISSEISNKVNEWHKDVQAEMAEVATEQGVVKQQMIQRKNYLDQTELRAPMSGIVKNLNITTIGGVIRPGEAVMEIVPLEDDLLVEAKVSPRDIAFLKQGMSATVKIDAYDYTVYGDLSGTVLFIGSVSVSC